MLELLHKNGTGHFCKSSEFVYRYFFSIVVLNIFNGFYNAQNIDLFVVITVVFSDYITVMGNKKSAEHGN